MPTLSFVLPIATADTGRDDRDLVRARRLCASLRRFLDRDCNTGILVVTPPTDLVAARLALSDFVESLHLTFVPETDLCPFLESQPPSINYWPHPNTGWFRQQLIKLAAHAHVPTAFYMTLDADVIFVRPFSAASLIKDGKAVLATLTADDFRSHFRPEVAAHEISVRKHRVLQAERALQMKLPEGLEPSWYGETPALLSREIVARMAHHLAEAWQSDWQEALLTRTPWTEYALYGLFAEATGLLDRYHRCGGRNAVLRLDDSLWRRPEDYLVPRGLENWDVERAFRPDGEGVAIVVQSYLGYELAEEAIRIRAFLPDASETSFGA